MNDQMLAPDCEWKLNFLERGRGGILVDAMPRNVIAEHGNESGLLSLLKNLFNSLLIFD
jgi:hypothetical protein